MNFKKTIPLITLFLLIISQQSASAAPFGFNIVNHELKECSSMFGGDECMTCQPPEGWEILSNIADCPKGYKMNETKIEYDQITCQPLKEPFCCTENHSGAPGDCDDTIMNVEQKKCAFVQNINECQKLPEGWQSTDLCPFEYEWQNNTLPCENENIKTNQNIEKIDLEKSDKSNLVWLVAAIGLATVLVLVIIFTLK